MHLLPTARNLSTRSALHWRRSIRSWDFGLLSAFGSRPSGLVLLLLSHHLHRPMRTYLSARVAARAFLQVDHVPRIRRHRDGINGAMLGTDRAAGAVLLHVIFDQRSAFAGWAAALQVR